ncbi:MAG: hypothetical protein J2P57_21425, partial [Acidimicrobiaceae bacterium]|nr:hypothetical protein [Acidimicrobiaceae bacterium]
MSHPLIPAPVSSESGGGPFVLRPGTIVAHPASDSSLIVERFCVEMARRTGLRLEARAGMPEPHAPAVRIEVAAQHELEALPAPQGLSPIGDAAPDERYRLVVHPEAVLL